MFFFKKHYVWGITVVKMYSTMKKETHDKNSELKFHKIVETIIDETYTH